MEKVNFKYMNHFIFRCIWVLSGCSFCSIFLIPQISQFSEWLVNTFNGTGLIISVFIAIILFSEIIIGAYILSMIITDKNGTAILYDNYVEIKLGENFIKINYNAIENMNFKELIRWHYRWHYGNPNLYTYNLN